MEWLMSMQLDLPGLIYIFWIVAGAVAYMSTRATARRKVRELVRAETYEGSE